MQGWKSCLAVLIALGLITPAWAQTTTDKGMAPATTDATKAEQKGEQAMAMQQALKDKGHDPGAIDGRMGPKTRTALKDYQKAEGMKMTGRPDAGTMTKLGIDMKTGAAATSSPAASPSMSDKADDAK